MEARARLVAHEDRAGGHLHHLLTVPGRVRACERVDGTVGLAEDQVPSSRLVQPLRSGTVNRWERRFHSEMPRKAPGCHQVER